MSLSEEIHAAEDRVKVFAEEHLPGLAHLAERAAQIESSPEAQDLETIAGISPGIRAAAAEFASKIAAELQALAQRFPAPAPAEGEPQ